MCVQLCCIIFSDAMLPPHVPQPCDRVKGIPLSQLRVAEATGLRTIMREVYEKGSFLMCPH
jgi:hypothetical protein